ncbi:MULTISPECIES: energy-coupling factor ABC transporter ATP-binding protein [Aerococcus]|uniref:Energy-coupling factor ABC transporter ATP-binding protein n=1 Tax=Aerococcus sanguinicola TaxID=119206 RepID=A0A5N1GN37_9LACT|nr:MULTISPECIES: energy-coupling factor ABC transporter ATP-binding protein [Aerococcus]KAA9302387.1 energy-coupling factor ABC transporter ATP-binding protein [Aerococcus sanguinicola]MDK6369761.1 energy-coupling factor ABC transporter ATP-binding protein [Aerococcus sp. UMB9870]MDK6680401.1 energy-coupling factor ABC transporter ATP-binding protein [Aerococcus sp. UMB8608]MDK6687102.1 energy-coupling factor ABC transporter ATP-binding protein [Aerococcus sp. UMB8623]MDK6940321.1 energy-coupl
MEDTIVRVEDLIFAYQEDQDRPTIQGVSFEIKRGEWLAVIGHNGSGKSTLAKLIDGLLEAQSGQIYVDGQELAEETVWEIRQKIGFVFQNPDNQFVGATVEDDVAFALENAGIPREEMVDRVNRALDQVNMSQYKDREPSSLSGGQKQRVAIAGVLALEPELIILDEATAMLDPEGRQEVVSLMQAIKESQEMTVLSITHDLKEASMADQIFVVNQGQIVKKGRPEEIFEEGQALVEMGLDVPFAEQLKDALQARGLDLPDTYLTEEGLVDQLCKLNSTR